MLDYFLAGTFGSLLLGLYLAMSSRKVVDWAVRTTAGSYRSFLLPLLLWLATSAYGKLNGQISSASSLVLLAYLVVPTALARADARLCGSRIRPSPTMILTVLSVWFPIEFGWLPAVLLPPGGVVPLQTVVAVIGGIYVFLVVRQLAGVGYTFRWSRSDFRLSMSYFALFMAFFAIPLGVSLQFVRSASEVPHPADWLLRMAVIYFLIALPEEFLFRGVIQNLLQGFTGRIWVALLASALIFGLAHANNPGPPYLEFSLGGVSYQFPWVYVVLAGIAGFFYGLTYLRTGKITTAALVHCLVDSWWSIFFRG